MDVNSQLLKVFNSNIDNNLYLESLGFNNNVSVYRQFTHLYAKVFFSILDKLDLDYYVFAGTTIGYIRNKQNIPWVDDYDIIIFKNEIEKFESEVIPILIKYGFNCDQAKSPYSGGGYQILSRFGANKFHCDVFYTIINNGIIKNTTGLWGLYNYKNVPIDIVIPKQYLTIDNDLTLPFFNNIEQDINIEYGDVLNNCAIYINHKSSDIVNVHFDKMYNAFNNIKQTSIENTFKLFKEHNYTSNLTLDNYDTFFEAISYMELFDKIVYFLKYINFKDVKNLFILDEKYLLFCVDLKFFFKNIQITFYNVKKLDNKNIILLNYVDKVLCSNKQSIQYLSEFDSSLIHKPIIDLIRVITFGTYDLFHHGHVNILKHSSCYGELIVGVSTDELNEKKGKKSINNLEKRKWDVYGSGYPSVVFEEESLELKNEYVKKYNCNLLIMGDDWKDAFNFCDCACLYLPRTPNISTTMLKQQLNIC